MKKTKEGSDDYRYVALGEKLMVFGEERSKLMDPIVAYDLADLSQALHQWATRVMYQLKTGRYNSERSQFGKYFIVSERIRSFIPQLRKISTLLRQLELDVEPGELVEVPEPDDGMIGQSFVALAKAIYGEHFDFETAMITVDKEGVIVTAFERKVEDDG